MRYVLLPWPVTLACSGPSPPEPNPADLSQKREKYVMTKEKRSIQTLKRDEGSINESGCCCFVCIGGERFQKMTNIWPKGPSLAPCLIRGLSQVPKGAFPGFAVDPLQQRLQVHAGAAGRTPRKSATTAEEALNTSAALRAASRGREVRRRGVIACRGPRARRLRCRGPSHNPLRQRRNRGNRFARLVGVARVR